MIDGAQKERRLILPGRAEGELFERFFDVFFDAAGFLHARVRVAHELASEPDDAIVEEGGRTRARRVAHFDGAAADIDEQALLGRAAVGGEVAERLLFAA